MAAAVTMALFTSETVILYLTRNGLWFKTSSELGTKPKYLDLSQSSLSRAFASIAAQTGLQQAKLITGNELSYTLSLPLTVAKTPSRKEIRQLVSEYVPTQVHDHNFDWQLKELNNNSAYIQAMVVSEAMLSSIQSAQKETGLVISELKPAPVLIVEQLPKTQQAQIVLWARWEPQLIIHNQGAVIHAQNMLSLDADEITSIRDYLSHDYPEITVQQSIIDWPENQNHQALASLADTEQITMPLDPLDFYSQLHEANGTDKQVLRLDS